MQITNSEGGGSSSGGGGSSQGQLLAMLQEDAPGGAPEAQPVMGQLAEGDEGH